MESQVSGLLSMDELENHTESLQYWLYPYVQKKGVIIIGAEPKSFKTFFVLQMMMAISTHKDFLGHHTSLRHDGKLPKVLYIDQEIGAAAFRKRYLPMKAVYGKPNMLVRVKSKESLLLDPGDAGRTRLEKLIAEQRPDIVVFDSFRKTTRRPENSSEEMAHVLWELTLLQEEYDFTAVIVHHASKPSEERKKCDPMSLRGSGEIFAHVDMGAILCRPNSDRKTHIDAHWFFRNEEDGEPLKMEFDRSSGLFIPRKPKEKETPKEPAAGDSKKVVEMPTKPPADVSVGDGILRDKEDSGWA